MKRLEKTKTVNGRTYHNFQCACGVITERRSDSKVSNCGCITNQKLLKNKKLPINSPFTLLEPIIDQKSRVLVRCKCGHEFKAHTTVIFRETTKYCRKCQNITEEYADIGGVRNHPAYNILDGMKHRCYNKESESYKYYGAIGVTICDEWLHSYIKFCLWADSNGFKPGMTIDRLDVNLGYSPDNCRWVSKTDQRENRHTQHNNTSGFTGVSFFKKLGKFESYYTYDNVKYRCGYFDTALEAHEAREKQLREKQINYNRQGKINETIHSRQFENRI